MSTPDFDGVARAYRWLEYLSLGPMLSQTRNCNMEWLRGRSRALILGDGDGRFTARLLARNSEVQVEAVDLSGGMLALLRRRCRDHADRLRTYCEDARGFVPRAAPDVVVTHFFLDCLTQDELEGLVKRLTPLLAPGAVWVVSDFRIPGGVLGFVARVYVRALYFAFRVLTGLRVTRLPDHAKALERCGFGCVARRAGMFGMLISEVWWRDDADARDPTSNGGAV